MGRKNRREPLDLYLPPIKDDRRAMPRCWKFPGKTVFTTGYRAQVAVDEIRARSDRDKTPVRVYPCEVNDGGCGYFHITSQEYVEDHNEYAASHPYLGATDHLDDSVRNHDHDYSLYGSGYTGAEF